MIPDNTPQLPPIPERRTDAPLKREELDRWDREMRPDRFAEKRREWKWPPGR